MDGVVSCFPANSVDGSSHRIIFDAIVEAYRDDVGEARAASAMAGVEPLIRLKKQAVCQTTIDSPALQQPAFTTPSCFHELVLAQNHRID